jgi:hypothetical protein
MLRRSREVAMIQELHVVDGAGKVVAVLREVIDYGGNPVFTAQAEGYPSKYMVSAKTVEFAGV